MAQFKLPLSGDVSRLINPMPWFMSGNSVNVYLGDSSAPEVEALDRVGTYGCQLGRVTDATGDGKAASTCSSIPKS